MPNDYAGNSAAWVAQVPVPSTTDNVDQAALEAAFKANADRSAYLRRVRPKAFSYANASSPLWVPTVSTQRSTGPGIYVDVPDCQVGDQIHVVAHLGYRFVISASFGRIELALVANAGGGTVFYVPGARVLHDNTFTSTYQGVPLVATIGGVWTSTTTGTMRACIEAQNTTPANFNLDSLALVATRYPTP